MNTATMTHDGLRAQIAEAHPIEQLVLDYHEITYGTSDDASSFGKRLRILESLCKHSLTIIDQERMFRSPQATLKAYDTVSGIFRETVEMLQIVQHS
jgi:hypothetical protein